VGSIKGDVSSRSTTGNPKTMTSTYDSDDYRGDGDQRYDRDRLQVDYGQSTAEGAAAYGRHGYYHQPEANIGYVHSRSNGEEYSGEHDMPASYRRDGDDDYEEPVNNQAGLTGYGTQQYDSRDDAGEYEYDSQYEYPDDGYTAYDSTYDRVGYHQRQFYEYGENTYASDAGYGPEHHESPPRDRLASRGSYSSRSHSSSFDDTDDRRVMVRKVSYSVSNPRLLASQQLETTGGNTCDLIKGSRRTVVRVAGNRSRVSSRGSYSSVSDGDRSDDDRDDNLRLTTRLIKGVVRSRNDERQPLQVSVSPVVLTSPKAELNIPHISPLFTSNSEHDRSDPSTQHFSESRADSSDQLRAPPTMVPSRPSAPKSNMGESPKQQHGSQLLGAAESATVVAELAAAGKMVQSEQSVVMNSNLTVLRDGATKSVRLPPPEETTSYGHNLKEPETTSDGKSRKQSIKEQVNISSNTLNSTCSAVTVEAAKDFSPQLRRPYMGDKKTNFFLNSVCISGGNTHVIYVCTSDSSIIAYDVFTGEKIATLTGHIDRVLCVACSNNADMYYEDPASVGSSTAPPAMAGVHFTVSGSRDETIRIWDLDNKCVKTIHAHKGPVWAVAAVLRDDVGYAVSCSDEGSIRVWNAATGTKMFNFKGQKGKVLALVIVDKRSPILELVSAGQDKTIHIWNLIEGKHVRLLEGHTNEVTCLSSTNIPKSYFSSSSALQNGGSNKGLASKALLLFSGSRDKTVRIWDYAEGVLLLVLPSHNSGLLAVCSGLTLRSFSKPVKIGEYTPLVICGTEDGTKWVWNMDTGKLIKSTHGHANGIKGLASAMFPLCIGNGSFGKAHEVLVVSCGWDKAMHTFSLDDFIGSEGPGYGCGCSVS
jgi:WD40 repeat protein